MEIVYGKCFGEDLDRIRLDEKTKKRLLAIIKKIKAAEKFASLKETKKIQGYTEYYRIRIGDYRLGLKLVKNRVELIRFLHRKDIYRRFP